MHAHRPFDVVLFGATGYTGRLIAQALGEQNLRWAIAGRDTQKLAALAAQLPGAPPILRAEASDLASVRAAARTARVFISAVGPFRQHGMAVAGVCLKEKCHYLDTSAEQQYILQVSRELDEPARRAGVAVCPAFGFDVAPGHLAAVLAAQALQRQTGGGVLQELALYYRFSGALYSRGSVQSMFAAATAPGVVWRGGQWEAARSAQEVRAVTLPDGQTRRGVLMPLGEVVSVPREVAARHVRAYVLLDGWLAPLARALWPVFSNLMNGPARPTVEKLLAQMPEGPSTPLRENMGYTIFARAAAADGRTAWASASGHDAYGLTGELLAVYAKRLAGADFAGAGVLTPGQVGDARWLQGQLKNHPIQFDLLAWA